MWHRLIDAEDVAFLILQNNQLVPSIVGHGKPGIAQELVRILVIASLLIVQKMVRTPLALEPSRTAPVPKLVTEGSARRGRENISFSFNLYPQVLSSA